MTKPIKESSFNAVVAVIVWVIVVPVLTFVFSKTLPFWTAFFVAAGIYSVGMFAISFFTALYTAVKNGLTKKDDTLL